MKKLEAVKKLVLKLDGRLSNLRNHGFVRYKPRSSSIAYIYIHRKKKVVVKRPFLTHASRAKDELPEHAVPTLVVDCPRHGWDELEKIFIQPLVDVSPDARFNAYSCLCNYDPKPPDFKSDNCGLYKQCPVIIDW